MHLQPWKSFDRYRCRSDQHATGCVSSVSGERVPATGRVERRVLAASRPPSGRLLRTGRARRMRARLRGRRPSRRHAWYPRGHSRVRPQRRPHRLRHSRATPAAAFCFGQWGQLPHCMCGGRHGGTGTGGRAALMISRKLLIFLLWIYVWTHCLLSTFDNYNLGHYSIHMCRLCHCQIFIHWAIETYQ